ncbi:hypothetical protein BegalDRAFT_1912 [Beggiatoa alba B18LD]|uniref:Uncharacterized protein n=1 Tax=Beggiatoa alba B18LD TaxID=395493 RepID=I3CGP1_9GAMM|nr:hypothetical protein [Beggiatoa alba]EIJ42784.1 hypothetical protein BegalDRAFT_1912 [Beggiatoa alba B18LD]
MKLTPHYTAGFVGWWELLAVDEQTAIHQVLIQLLNPETLVTLPLQRAQTEQAQMGELHIMYGDYTYNILYAIDLAQSYLVLVGGIKKPISTVQ